MELTPMYDGMSNSPKTFLVDDITAGATSFSVDDASLLPEAPNIAVIGSNNSAEVILYSKKNGNILTGVVRGAGFTTASAWAKDTVVARNFTLLDYYNLRKNIIDLNDNKRENSVKINAANEIDGLLPVANGGTGVGTVPAIKSLLGLAAMAYKSIINLIEDVTGILPIVNGGTGLSASPSVLTDLSSNNAADILAASPRPGVTGTLPVANGGTGQTTLAGLRQDLGLGSETGPLSPNNGGTGQTSLEAARNAMGLGNSLGPVPVANGGTGAETPANARLNLGITNIAMRPDYLISTTSLTPGESTLASGQIYFFIGS